jgi:sortase A
LIGISICILAAILVTEGTVYPWRQLFSGLGFTRTQTVDELPEPAPLPENFPLKDNPPPAPREESATEEKAEILIEAPAFTLTRPKLELVQLGTIKIPEISLSENIVSGTGDELHYGVGHMPFSPLPGETGNCALAAHRNIIWARAFRHLDKLAEGDEITINYGGKIFTYTVYSIFTVEPHEKWILGLQPGETHMLTLITCTPVLNPTHRLIVWARLLR